MKTFTDIEQSKKLAEILPLESADCFWDYDDLQKYHRISWFEDGFNKESQLRLNENNVCAWSLAALLDILPDSIYDNTYEFSQLEFTKKSVAYMHGATDGIKIGALKDNLVDACYKMIIKLNELKIL